MNRINRLLNKMCKFIKFYFYIIFWRYLRFNFVSVFVMFVICGDLIIIVGRSISGREGYWRDGVGKRI